MLYYYTLLTLFGMDNLMTKFLLFISFVHLTPGRRRALPLAFRAWRLRNILRGRSRGIECFIRSIVHANNKLIWGHSSLIHIETEAIKQRCYIYQFVINYNTWEKFWDIKCNNLPREEINILPARWSPKTRLVLFILYFGLGLKHIWSLWL